MNEMLPECRHSRSQLGLAAQKAKRDPTPTNLEAARCARRDYAAVALAAHIARVVDHAPPLTVAQRDRLVNLLRGAA